MTGKRACFLAALLLSCGGPAVLAAGDFPKPYVAPCMERENRFEFARSPAVRKTAPDQYAISFASKAGCDATVAIVDETGTVVRHLACGVLGANAPAPFQKNTLEQQLVWNGKDDLDQYVANPGRCRARVSLGLKPVFERLLGVSHPKNIPGYVLGIAADEAGVYVWIRGQGTMGHVTIRKFDHAGQYLQTLTPPPSGLSEAKLAGRSYIEYEPGKRSHFGPMLMQDLGYDSQVLPGVGGRGLLDFQPVIVKGRMYFCNAGPGYRSGTQPSMLYYVHTDGSTDIPGMRGRAFAPATLGHEMPRLAASPDGRWLYVSGVGSGSQVSAPVILRAALDGTGTAEPFVGVPVAKRRKMQFDPGSDNESLNGPDGVDVDAEGRVYVADTLNNRVQVFSPDGAYLKTIPADRPRLLQIDRKTGAIYLQHSGVVKGRTVHRLAKITSFDKPVVEFFVDGIQTAAMAIDPWAPKLRIWIGGAINRLAATTTGSYYDYGAGVSVWEEGQGTFRQVLDFDEEMRQLGGADYCGRWEGSCYDKVVCDPVRETLWWCWEKNQGSRIVFDLKTGHLLGEYTLYGPTDDIAFDKRGFLHTHFNPGFYQPGVSRLNPDKAARYRGMARFRLPHERVLMPEEVPYNYGVSSGDEERSNWKGILPVKDQPGAKFFQDGFGVDMKGAVAEQCNIYYVPKMEEDGWNQAAAGRAMRDRLGQGSGPSAYPDFLRWIEERAKAGEQVYSLRRTPGLPLSGATIWTFDPSGKLRQESAVIAHKLIIGAQIDEDGSLYFANDGARMIDGKPFLQGKGGNLGSAEPFSPYGRTPVTYTYVKSRPRDVRWLVRNAAVPLEPLPSRPTDIVSQGPFGPPVLGGGEMWVEGAEWMYAGYSPGVPAGCTCPSTRAHLDWFKRSYIPEGYRHAIAILDTAGNFILRVGRYGNTDDALAMKPGTEDVALTLPRFISGTDNYLAFDDWGERLVVLKLGYQAESVARIGE